MPHYTKVYETGRVYGLIDPQTNEIKYIGATIKPLRERLCEHKIENMSEHCDRRLWVRQLQANGFQPEMIELEEVPFSELPEAEKFWMAYFKMLGSKLTNTVGLRNHAGPYRIRLRPQKAA